MQFTIATCPHCGTFVLSDTPHCHVCRHALDSQESAKATDAALPTDAAVNDDLEVCGNCGETYRTGLVRCWNCGVFTRPEIEAAYEKMVSNHGGRAPDVFDLPELNAALASVTQDVDWMSPPPFSSGESDGGRMGLETTASDDDFEFELADNVQLSDARLDEPRETEDTYSLQTPVLVTPAEETRPEPEVTEIPQLATPTDPEPASAPVAETPSVASPVAETTPAAPTTDAPPPTVAGDALLEIAKEEETDIERSKRTYRQKVRGGFVVYCPMGCRIRVQDKHRGKAGKCPKCGSVFVVPAKTAKKAAEAEAAAAAPQVVPWRAWMNDVRLHTVIPTKLRIKADSLLNEVTAVDLVAMPEGLVLLTLATGGGMFGAGDKKKPALRTAAQEHLKTVGKLDGIPNGTTKIIKAENLGQLLMAQPCPPDVDSLFGDIPVFGAQRIAVKLPKLGDEPGTPYLSFFLSDFRQFSQMLADVYAIQGFGSRTEVPLTDTYKTLKCHYTEAAVQELHALPYYQKDPQIKLNLSGWRCSGCGLIVSEDGRRKEKLGGLNGKAIAKTKCPKCKAKFGNNPLYAVAPPEAAAAPATTEKPEPAAATATA